MNNVTNLKQYKLRTYKQALKDMSDAELHVEIARVAFRSEMVLIIDEMMSRIDTPPTKAELDEFEERARAYDKAVDAQGAAKLEAEVRRSLFSVVK
jgi:ABC-type sugar transport system ATPase subunit